MKVDDNETTENIESDDKEIKLDDKIDNEDQTSSTCDNLFSLDQKCQPVRGDKILFFSKERNSWNIKTYFSCY